MDSCLCFLGTEQDTQYWGIQSLILFFNLPPRISSCAIRAGHEADGEKFTLMFVAVIVDIHYVLGRVSHSTTFLGHSTSINRIDHLFINTYHPQGSFLPCVVASLVCV